MNSIITLFKSKELRNKVLFSILLLFIFRIISYIPVPWTNLELLKTVSDSSGLLSFANMFSGGALSKYTMGATGISAYISASIIIQVITFISPTMHQISKEPGGSYKIKRLTIFFGILSAILSSIVTTYTLNKTYSILTNEKWYVYAIIAILHAIGTAIAIWVGETITEKGFGEGVSLLIFLNIVTGIPSQISTIISNHKTGNLSTKSIIAIIITIAIIIVMITLSEITERRVPVRYTKASIKDSNTVFESYFPLKLNLTGVMPVIFANYLFMLAYFVVELINNEKATAFFEKISTGTYGYAIIMGIIVFIFTFGYSFISIDVKEISKSIQIQGGIIPGIRQGDDTQKYLKIVVKTLTILNALYLTLVLVIPLIIFTYFDVTILSSTSIIIMVNVSLSTVKSLYVETKLREDKKL